MSFQTAPNPATFDLYRVTNPNFSQCVWQPLYDFNIYPGAGVQSLPFFQTPVGAGLTSALGATAGTPKTQHDTNMQLAGQLPSGLQFMAEGLEVAFYPGSVSTANTYTNATIAFFTAAAAATVGAAQLNDPNVFLQAGLLNLNILNAAYVTVPGTVNFPPRSVMDLQAAIASNSATVGEVGAAIVRAGGNPFELNPPIALQPAVAFNVTLTYPAVVALPSGFNARVGVFLQGWQFRAGQ